MRRFVALLVIVAVAVAALYFVGPSLPEGNPLRAAGDGLRSIGENIGDGFGGGYGQLPAGG